VGFIVSRAIYVAAKLGIADLLTDGPRDVDELAARSGAHPPSLYRFLRALGSVGIFTETAPRTFALTESAEMLRTDIPGSLRAPAIYYNEYSYRTWERPRDASPGLTPGLAARGPNRGRSRPSGTACS
jgi:hypothetical protein